MQLDYTEVERTDRFSPPQNYSTKLCVLLIFFFAHSWLFLDVKEFFFRRFYSFFVAQTPYLVKNMGSNVNIGCQCS